MCKLGVQLWRPYVQAIGRLALFGVESFVKWRFPNIGGTILGVPIRRTIVFWGLYWGSLILGNYQISMVMCPHPGACLEGQGDVVSSLILGDSWDNYMAANPKHGVCNRLGRPFRDIGL